LLSEAYIFLQILYFSIQEHLALLLFYNISRLSDRLTVPGLEMLGLRLGLVSEHCIFLLIRGFRIRFAVKDELRPAFIAAKYLKDFFIVAVMGT